LTSLTLLMSAFFAQLTLYIILIVTPLMFLPPWTS